MLGEKFYEVYVNDAQTRMMECEKYHEVVKEEAEQQGKLSYLIMHNSFFLPISTPTPL